MRKLLGLVAVLSLGAAPQAKAVDPAGWSPGFNWAIAGPNYGTVGLDFGSTYWLSCGAQEANVVSWGFSIAGMEMPTAGPIPGYGTLFPQYTGNAQVVFYRKTFVNDETWTSFDSAVLDFGAGSSDHTFAAKPAKVKVLLLWEVESLDGMGGTYLSTVEMGSREFYISYQQ